MKILIVDSPFRHAGRLILPDTGRNQIDTPKKSLRFCHAQTNSAAHASQSCQSFLVGPLVASQHRQRVVGGTQVDEQSRRNHSTAASSASMRCFSVASTDCEAATNSRSCATASSPSVVVAISCKRASSPTTRDWPLEQVVELLIAAGDRRGVMPDFVVQPCLLGLQVVEDGSPRPAVVAPRKFVIDVAHNGRL